MKCEHCGRELTRVPTETDEWRYVDSDGKEVRDELADAGIDVHQYLADLSERIRAGQATDAEAAHYSILSAAVSMGSRPWIHWHTPDADAHEGEVPECCGWPAWLRPSGWWCRVERKPLEPAHI